LESVTSDAEEKSGLRKEGEKTDRRDKRRGDDGSREGWYVRGKRTEEAENKRSVRI
jgi:hypothetical protein